MCLVQSINQLIKHPAVQSFSHLVKKYKNKNKGTQGCKLAADKNLRLCRNWIFRMFYEKKIQKQIKENKL